MSNWREDYYAALVARDKQEQANSSLYDAYTRLADRTAANAALVSRRQSQPPEVAGNPSSPKRASTPQQQQKQRSQINGSGAGAASQSALLAARADLAAAQRSRSELQEQLNRTTAELDKLKSKTQQDSRRITSLEGERTHLILRLKDRDEELRGKAKLLDSVQDELASLNLQLNMAEDRSSRLQRENQELIDRWMARMGKEADAMNEASKF
ncbi:autophagy protein Apg16, putative [Talaromyces stipitatus ATCC 10500]|uniref:Autophagy protein Apg16, putative n=1 Tax=Talaromyces stipitatus (strain ATCC 10500 / CBS 375.48 / QM 6759 / NRRL 1006) TaxID=441959 RepID=B8LXF5_TALSN|nr:autophagy protein Apg16, putative [Talaromyces stipitatus ATCC 10500]EED23236.1 autophagy protein Apg16, putative [Talaromyces stipitatus ATCC 10500]